MIDGASHIREQVWISVGVAGYQRSDHGIARNFGHGPELGVCLEVGTIGIARERIEMIPIEDHIGTELIGSDPRLTNIGVGVRVLLLDLDSDSYRKVAHLILFCHASISK